MPDVNGNLSPMEAISSQEVSIGRPLTQPEANAVVKANDEAIQRPIYTMVKKGAWITLYLILALVGIDMLMKLMKLK
jgi:hypothetical protein